MLILLSLGVIYVIFLQSKLPELLSFAWALKSARHEVQVILTIFSLVMISAPLAIVPSGAVMVAGALAGYIYGMPGIALAWPGLSLGLFITFALARLASTHGDEQAKESGDTFNEAEVAHNSLPTCLQGRHAKVFIRGSLRLLKDQPKRTAILMTFASHAPLTMFLFGWTTDMRWTDAGLACLIDGVKVIVPLIKGMAISDVLDIISTEEGKLSCWEDGTHCSALIMKICVSIAVGIVFFLMAREMMREIREMDEEEEGRSLQDDEERPLLADDKSEDSEVPAGDNDSLNEGAGRENEVNTTYGAVDQ